MTTVAIDDRRAGSSPQLRLLEPAPAITTSVEGPLLERDAELDVLHDAVNGLAKGAGRVVVIDGSAGLGKSALVEYAATIAARAGCSIRRAAPSPQERQFAFGVVRTLLETPLIDASVPERAHLLDGAAAAAGALLLDGVMPPGEDATPIAHSVFWLSSRLAQRRPLALLVDDAQWSDRQSLEVLSYLARRIDDVPVVIVVAVRAGDPRAATDLLSLLGGARSAFVLHPQPLSPRGAATLIRRHAPDTSMAVCLDCHRSVEGNPWLLSELGRQVAEHGPSAVRDCTQGVPPVSADTVDTVRRLLSELTPRDRAVAAAQSVIGDGAPQHAVAAVAGMELEDLVTARESLTAAGIFGAEGERFAHPLVAAAIKLGIVPAERERLHREAATALASLDAPALQVAGHLLHCRPARDHRASALMQSAAEQAAHQGDPKAAAAYLERALSERAPDDDRGRLLARLATVAFHAGYSDSRRRLRDALGEARDLASRIDVLTRLAALGVARGDDAGISDLLARLALETEPEARAAIEAATLDALLTIPERHDERARLAASIELDDTSHPLIRRVVLAHRGWLAAELGTPGADAAAALALEAMDGGLLLRDAWQGTAYHLCVLTLVMTDRVPEARQAIDDLAAEALMRGSRRLRAIASWYAAELALRTGQVSEAERRAAEALEVADDEIRACVAGAAGVLVSALTERGAFHAAREVLCTHGLDCQLGRSPADSRLLHARARLWLAEGDFERAHADARELGERAACQGRPNPTWGGWRSIASLALAHLGRRCEAAALADAEVELARQFGAPVAVARALHARAVAEPDDEARLALCRRALEPLDDGSAVLESARLRLELGSTLARMGRRVEAREALRPALADADACGALVLAKRARRELVATGMRPRRAAFEGVAALTPRQRQICELAAAGKGNKAISRELFLSIKTVETHLAAAYRKLGVSTRSSLRVALAG
ncbi:MAG TPA: AAA family ATPase [Solirubrobacteraceae bacterium]|nr:AAA family ATPase [Solirubrobacteraceae bacterium]